MRAVRLAVGQETLLPEDNARTIGNSYRQTKVIRAVTSQKQLWSELYNKYQSELVHYLQGKWRKEPDDASDIAHQAFERFMTVAEPQGIQQPRAYLYQLARNLVVDGLRREKVRVEHAQREEPLQEVAATDSALQSVLGDEQLQSLQQIIEKLPAKRRRAFVLNRVYQMSYQEIAEEMGISPDGVKKHVLRALETCQEHLQKRFEE